MIWPNLIVDNFFTDPDEIVEISKRYTYKNDGGYPGVRTPPLHQVDHAFFNWSTKKILAFLYPNEVPNLSWAASATFHRIPNNLPNPQLGGWVHTDSPSEFTAILYLSKEGIGTSLFEPVSPEIVLAKEQKMKYNYFENPKLSAKEVTKIAQAKEKNNSGFREILSVNGKYNRLFLFDAAHYHGVHVSKNSDLKSTRLTYIIFFNKITLENSALALKYPGTESRRI